MPPWSLAFLHAIDPPIPEPMQQDTEVARRAHLTARFGLLGSIFGMVYAVFYMMIEHRWGALIVLSCSAAFAATSFVLRRVRRVEIAGNMLVLTMALGFCALCLVEGGIRGHAIAWLVGVPLCALLLVGTKAARWWALIIFGAASLIASVDLSGKKLPETFDPKWNPLVSAAGYLGLILFMYALGLIFESSRARAFGRMQDALRELAANNEHLVRLNTEKNEFLGIAAHDLKSPLTVILGCAEMINISHDPRHVHKMSDSIVAATTRMRDLINDLLDANAIEQGKFASKLEPCDLYSLVKQIVDNNQPAAARKNITLLLGATEGLWAKADKAATAQILENLISNALKFSPPMTTVHVHTMPEAENMIVTVRDQGPGLSEEDQKKMFGKFTRLTARPTGGETSTGLGLSIVKRLAEAMSGTVQCHSVLGAGATFSLRLPKCPAKEVPGISVVASKPQPVCIPFPTSETGAALRQNA
ncbi:MAG TPA: HAMP domain-containing sensor histidine kinase [Candidatus Saccharimonadales bacterium]|nr:HAMP domain-containing sensor histidine kinase [Candidatus Saccharimonadales bacterium]